MNETETRIQNPHDKFFRAIFSNLEVSRGFLKEALPESILSAIDLDTLELQNGTYVGKELEETRSDLLFRTAINQKEGYLYLLFEHKSYPDKNVGLQLLNYLVSIWNQKIKNEKTGHLPVIVPMVIYHGHRSWELGHTLDTMISDYGELSAELKKGIPNFSYQLYDLNGFSDEQIVLGSQFYVAASIMKHVNRQDEPALLAALTRVMVALNAMAEKETALECFETCLRYVYEVVPGFTKAQSNHIQKSINQTFPEGSELAMTLAEVLREEGFEKGKIEGIEVGKKEGIEAGKKELAFGLALNRLTKKFGIMPSEYREKISTLDLNSLETLNYEIDDFKTLEDLRAFLRL